MENSNTFPDSIKMHSHDQQGTDIETFSSSIPIQNLVTDVLSTIFRFCVTERGIDPITPCRRCAPFNISQVCREWRRLALADSNLWTTICIELAEEEIDAHLATLDRYLERSNDRPLSMEINLEWMNKNWIISGWIRRTDPGASKDPIYRNWDGVVKTQLRWKSLKLCAVIGLGPELDLVNTPLLEDLDLQIPSYSGCLPFKVHLEGMPRIRNLEVNGCVDLVFTGATLANLQTVSIFLDDEKEGISTEEFWQLISNAPSLRKIRLHVIDLDSHSAIELKPVLLKDLQHLEILIKSPLHAVAIFNGLTLPRLDTLHVSLPTFDNHGPGIAEMIRRSDAPVTNLHFGMWDQPEELRGCLQLCPDLKRLALQDIRTTADVMADLTFNRGDNLPNLCQHLEIIELGHSSEFFEWKESFETMLVSRWRQVNPEARCLKEVKYIVFREDDDADIDFDSGHGPELQSCISEGLKVEVVYE